MQATRSYLTQRTWRGALCALFGLIVFSTAAAENLGPSEWPAEIMPALEVYRAGRYDDAREIAAAVASRTTDPVVQNNAALLIALCGLQSVSRDDIAAGQAFVVELGRQDPSLLVRPEVLLAKGVSSATLMETSNALLALREAADGFARLKNFARQAVALAELARVWSIHTEWESTPQFDEPQPRTGDDVRAVRVREVRAIQKEAASLAGVDEALVAIDLTLARLLLAAESTREEAVGLLKRLADEVGDTPSLSAARMELAAVCLASDDPAAAYGLLRQVAGGGVEPFASEAQRRVAEIERPRVQVDAPSAAAPGTPVPIRLRARNLQRVEVEVRRVALREWLESRQGHFSESDLPESGSLRLSETFDVATSTPLGWWSTDDLETPLQLEAEAGAYVLVVRAQSGADVSVHKQLLVLSDIQAALVCGVERAAIWACDADGAPLADAEARFWMFGSFVPTVLDVSEGAVCVSLPPESRILRDKRCVCLVEAGGQLALCQGSLPGRKPGEDGVAQAIVFGEAESPAPGETFHVGGRLLTASGLPPVGAENLTFEASDAMDNIVANARPRVGVSGAFDAEFTISDEAADRVCRGVLMCGRQSIPNARGRFMFRTAPRDESMLEAEISAPLHVDEGERWLRGEAQAQYAWGTPLTGRAGVLVRAMHLPTTEANDDVCTDVPIHIDVDLSDSKTPFEADLAVFELPPGPTAYSTWVIATGWDGRQVADVAVSLRAPEPVHTWLLYRPIEPRVGAPIHFQLGWFDPTNETRLARQEAVVSRDGVEEARLLLNPTTDGLVSEPWVPAEAGEHRCECVVVGADGVERVVATSFEVAPREDDGSPVIFNLTAESRTQDGATQVVVRVVGESDAPLAIVLRSDEPVSLHPLPNLHGEQEVTLAPPAGLTPRMTVDLVALGDSGLELLAQSYVAPKAFPGRLALDVDDTPVTPGQAISVHAGLAGVEAASGDVLLRLVEAGSMSTIHWEMGETRDLELDNRAVIAGTSSRQPRDPARVSAATAAELPPLPYMTSVEMTHLLAGSTERMARIPVSGSDIAATITAPDRPGDYRLLGVWVTADGWSAADVASITVTAPVSVDVSLPRVLQVGDCVDAVISVRNDEAGLVEVDVSASLSGELTPFDGPEGDLGPQHLSVRPHSVERRLVRVKAAQGGTGALSARVEVGGRSWMQASTTKVVSSEKPSVDAPQARVRRRVFRLVDAETGDDLVAVRALRLQSFAEEALRVELASEESVQPGTMLIVQDEIAVDAPIEDLVLTQQFPANTLTAQSDVSTLTRAGVLREQTMRSQTYLIPRLAGVNHNEFLMIAERPGVAALPPPVLRKGDQAGYAAIEPAAWRLSVARPPASE